MYRRDRGETERDRLDGGWGNRINFTLPDRTKLLPLLLLVLVPRGVLSSMTAIQYMHLSLNIYNARMYLNVM